MAAQPVNALVDSDVLIDVLRGLPSAREWLIDLRLANVTPESSVTPETQGFREAAVLR